MNYKKVLSSFLITVLLLNNLFLMVSPAQAEPINNSGTSKPGLPACQSLSFAIAGRKEVPQARLVSNYVPETDELVTLSFSPSYEERRINSATAVREGEVKKYYSLIANLTLLQSITTNNPITTNNYYLYQDHLSSTSIVYTDQGEVVEEHQYTPFGSSVIARSPDPNPELAEGRVLSVVEGEGGRGNPIGADDDIKNNRHAELKAKHPLGIEDDENVTDKLYTSQTKDTSTDLYYYHARYYDPVMARFLQPDTMVGGNRYQYVGNNPVNFSDPTGHRADPGGANGGGIVPNGEQPPKSPENNVLFFPLALNGASAGQRGNQGVIYPTKKDTLIELEQAELYWWADFWRWHFLNCNGFDCINAGANNALLYKDTGKLMGLAGLKAIGGEGLTLHERIGDLIIAGSAGMDVIAQTYVTVVGLWGLGQWAYGNYKYYTTPMPIKATEAELAAASSGQPIVIESSAGGRNIWGQPGCEFPGDGPCPAPCCHAFKAIPGVGKTEGAPCPYFDTGCQGGGFCTVFGTLMRPDVCGTHWCGALDVGTQEAMVTRALTAPEQFPEANIPIVPSHIADAALERLHQLWAAAHEVLGREMSLLGPVIYWVTRK